MITETNAALAIKYLYAAQTIQPTDGIARVWADYLNHEVPDIRPQDLEEAARTAIHDWAAAGRGWRIDVGRFTDAVRKVRRARLDSATRSRPLIPEGVEDPEAEVKWRREATRMLMAGASRDEAEAAAWRDIGLTPPIPLPQTPHQVHVDQIGA